MWINKREIEAKVMLKIFHKIHIFHFTVLAKIACELISAQLN